MNSRPVLRPSLLAVAAALAALPALAQDAKPADDKAKSLELVTVTGSRASIRSVADSTSPVDVIDGATIAASGAVELGRLLQELAPSFNFPQSFVSDGTDLIWPASLRGMGPDQVLVLVNGKRRHQQALVNVQQSIGRGSAGTDINTIPVSAIERIEVLRDGASAQYGSDAIAGVINIVLKRTKEGGSASGEYSQTSKGDGDSWRIGANTGFRVGNGFLSLTAEYLDRGETNRAGPDSLRVSPAKVTQRIGDAATKSKLLWLNAEVPIDQLEFYVFGGLSSREGNSSGFYRSAGDGRTIPALYPNGFLPTLLTTTDDWSLAVGLRGQFAKEWSWDASLNQGHNQFEFASSNTANVSWYYEPKPGGGIYADTPTSAKDGTLRFRQTTANFDVKGQLDWGIGKEPLYVAAGAEWRTDGFQIVAGDPVSYAYGRTNNGNIFIANQTGSAAAAGIQGFPGFTPGTEVDKSRHSLGVYADAESSVTDSLVLGAAMRFEDYSDFGKNATGKLSMRLRANEAVAFRGSVNTGFRAPGIQQQYFSQVSTTLGAQGKLTDTVTARQGSPLAAAFGIQPLKDERSKSATLGMTVTPAPGVSLTADFYDIRVKDRIVFSSEIGPEANSDNCVDAKVCPVRVILRGLNLGAATLFTNAIDTKTTGADIVGQYTMKLSGGDTLQMDASYSYNKTKVTAIHSQSSVLASSVLFDQTQRTLIQEALPHHRAMLGGTWRTGAWRINLNNTYYGEVSGQGFTGVKQTWSGKWLTDLSVGYKFSKQFEVTAGGQNIFNVYPDKWSDAAGFPLNALGFTYGWETLPFGLNGARYFVRGKYSF
ncbi:TonB-dependent receptor [Pelomonas sp. SE-A7]|uniref:TonB-dependent receptor plug domain-containing protein n=1 Tax=Pelomonas sp. SE-A7 TaxID=3054953 RepID=UPI00259C925E|nr:TonB-dependent receptor [Pelomonas sp. SE-A7]MDM4764757.1 TonB-dependent receptor [Pelomonas sp. SE-A7]